MRVTMTSIEVAHADWKLILAKGASGQKLLDGPLRLYFGADAVARPVFFLVADEQSDAPKFAQAVSVEHGRRADGKWTVVLTLQDMKLLDTFIGMCLEIARRVAMEPSESSALALFDRIIHQWRQLLTPGPPTHLSDRELRGLVGELEFVRLLGDEIGRSAAIASWVGPLGAPQDFRLSNGELYEVKCVRTGARSIRISSVEQLDTEDKDHLELVLIRVDDSPTSSPRSVTVVDQIKGLRHATKELADAQAIDQRLSLLKVDITDPYYELRHFEIGARVHFQVSATFPRIHRTALPLGILNVKYELLRSALDPFEIASDLGRLSKVQP